MDALHLGLCSVPPRCWPCPNGPVRAARWRAGADDPGQWQPAASSRLRVRPSRAQPRVMLAAFPPGPRGATQGSHASNDPRIVVGSCQLERFKTQFLQQVHLAVLAVVEHPLVPAVVHGLPIPHAFAEVRSAPMTLPTADAIAPMGNGQALKAPYAARSYRARGVHPHPAALCDPYLCPGMGIAGAPSSSRPASFARRPGSR